MDEKLEIQIEQDGKILITYRSLVIPRVNELISIAAGQTDNLYIVKSVKHRVFEYKGDILNYVKIEVI